MIPPRNGEGHLHCNSLLAPRHALMKDPVYKLIELTGTSTTSIEDAVAMAIKRAHKSVKNLSWFQVIETRGNIVKGKVHHWQVTLKIGFAVED